MARNKRDFDVRLGETWHPTIRWGTGTMTSKPVTGVTQATPIVITATGHGVPNGWPAALVGVQGMTEANATRYPPQGDDWHYVTVQDANTVSFNDEDSSGYSAYTSGGFLVYDTPQDLSGYSFSLTIWDTALMNGTQLASLTSNPAAGITADNVLKTITPLLQTAALTWTTGYYRLDATDGAGIVTELLRGAINIQ